ncbi:MAG: hypothetical protein JSV80_09765, partial [Acidobacteriota bacterium]
SGGWITSTFDMTSYRGRKIYLAFVFGADSSSTNPEGWYIDQVKIESEKAGAPICQVTQWPGSVPATTSFLRVGADQIEASWQPSCNEGSPAGQAYSIQAGSLDDLHTGASYGHTPLDGICTRTSPETFTAGAGNEYYLVVPNQAGREGGAGTDAAGSPRPQLSTLCGEPREASCP